MSKGPKNTSKNKSRRPAGRNASQPLTLTEKILSAHLVEGELIPGTPIGIRIDQTLTQDATGTMAWLQFEALGLKQVRTERSVSYVDHNTLQTSFENADDHAFLQSAARKFGAVFSRLGNGICHQVHLERFGRPGATLLGSDSHTPTAGGLGMLGIGAGGLDVAAAMAGAPFFLACPEVLNVRLQGKLKPGVSAKDVILEILGRLTVKGGVGKVLEYTGPGLLSLTVPERATLTNMGAELGATTSLFPADAQTKAFLAYQGRSAMFRPWSADAQARYAGELTVDLGKVVPMAAQPHSPDAVVKIQDLAGLKPRQVVIGSCTNSSLEDMVAVAGFLAGKRVHPAVSLVITPGSQQVLAAMAGNGSLAALIEAGARIMEPACGACIGMGQAPASGAISLRTFNRNFKGRSGTPDARVYLVSPQTAALAALTGEIQDPRKMKIRKSFSLPKRAKVSDSLLLFPEAKADEIEIVRGPNIRPLPEFSPLAGEDQGRVLLKLGDNITTDDIMPAGAKVLPLRSNIPAISNHVFAAVDADFPERARNSGGGYVVAGENYGQGSSREHAALAPRYLGVRAVLTKSFARIHRANLINFGILPLVFKQAGEYDQVQAGDELYFPAWRERVQRGGTIRVVNRTRGSEWEMLCELTPRQRDIILAGGMLNSLKQTFA